MDRAGFELLLCDYLGLEAKNVGRLFVQIEPRKPIKARATVFLRNEEDRFYQTDERDENGDRMVAQEVRRLTV